LRDAGKPSGAGFDQPQFIRQMFGIEGAACVQIGHHLFSNHLRLPIGRPAMHHAMPDGHDWMTGGIRLNNLHHRLESGFVVWRGDCLPNLIRRARCINAERGLRLSDPRNLAMQQTKGRIAQAKNGELDARRATVHGQDAIGRGYDGPILRFGGFG
jgi:hypothetical protein